MAHISNPCPWKTTVEDQELLLVTSGSKADETLFQKNHKQFNKNMGLSRKVCPPTLMEHLGLWEEVCIFQVSQCYELVVGVGDLAQW